MNFEEALKKLDEGKKLKLKLDSESPLFDLFKCLIGKEDGYNGEYMIWFPPYDVEYPDFGHYTIREFDLY